MPRKRTKLGKAFSDSLRIERRRERRFVPDDRRAWWLGAGRVLLFALLFFVSFFILTVRMFSLTVVHGHEYKVLADGNRTREIVRHAPRGLLLDRTGKPLTENIPEYRLIRPCERNEKSAAEGNCVTYLSREKGQELAKAGLPPGEFLEVDFERRYIDGTALAHLLGYTGEITEQELTDQYYTLHNYHRGDRLGRTGAEAVFEDRLRGRDGKELEEVDSAGKIVRTLGRDTESPGNDVTLSVDADLSEAVRKAFPATMNGTIIVSRPSTGEILAMYSNPSYDPNVFSTGLSKSEYDRLVDDPDQPLFNRAVGGVYPPGSTFKIVTALAALESGTITSRTTIEDTGVITTGQFSFANWYYTQYGKTEGMVDVVKALQRSNDIFFYKVGEMMGISTLATWARRMGAGKPTGIELGGEASGLMPDPAWKDRTFHTPADLKARNNRWYDGDTYHVAIGQGYLLATPLQVNLWTNIIASGGMLCKPTVEKVTTDSKLHPADCKSLNIPDETVRLIRTGMQKACATGGTGWPLFDLRISDTPDVQSAQDTGASPSASVKPGRLLPVACKTGTAEIGDAAGQTHAWFTMFAPLPSDRGTPVNSTDDTISGPPELSITILIEKGGEGSTNAAPVAKKILQYYFSR